jgi:hypothetical protein
MFSFFLFYFISFLIFGHAGDWTQCLYMLGKHFITWATLPALPFCFWDRISLFFFFFNGTGIWAQGLILARPHPFFALIIFPVGSQVFAQGLRPQSFYIYSHSIAGITGAHHHTQLIDWDRVSLTFRPGCLELRSCWSPSPE